ncbi:hypothetical protein C8A00DRAFT_42551 [Chaetomidium leptoderma]|uniref:E3 ubiquitin-protein ligase n=1 Tax=Chaetomidium leptoderma TaxID=669021 RepID=A0AAN6ZWP1_9PEZI|nr:hypothetical protein C8A00DRAFT_42551 [Chaetomidium leptoderma]
MVLNISESGVMLESSAKATAGLPTQAFAIALSGSVIEDMIACVQNGGDIQLALGSNPKFLFDDHELRIPKTSDPSGYDLFWANSENPSRASKLPDPTMSIFLNPKHRLKAKAPKAPKPTAKGESVPKKAPARPTVRSSNTAPRPASTSTKDLDSQKGSDDAATRLERSFADLAAGKRENSAVIVGGLPSSKGGKLNTRLLDAQASASPRPLPPSPALSGIGSPSLPPSSNTPQERAKRQRLPILHELAVQELSRQDLLAGWHEGHEADFDAALDKVADFDKDLQKWVLRRNSYKELDVFEYNYADDEDRQRAINNAIKNYDRLRLSASDPLWQKLLPKSERGKGICLSRLQATLAKGPAQRQRVDTASVSGLDSDKDDSASSTTKMGKGGEAMSRSSSQASAGGKKKLSASEAQAKRMLSVSKKKAVATTTAKAAPKAPAPKPAAKAVPVKGGRVLSKEFVSDSSSSDDDEVPLSTAKGKPNTAAAPAPKLKPKPKPMQRAAEKPRVTEKTKEVAAPKPKPAAAAKLPPREQKVEKEKDTIRAEVIAKPIRPPTKRPRDADDDDSSSSGAPLIKRVKPGAKAFPAPVSSAKGRTASDASQNSRGTNSGVAAAPKAKNTSPTKSSPLASSPPTNASEVEQERRALARARDRERERERDIERERERERARRRDTAVRSSSSNTDSSASTSSARKRPPTTDSFPGNRVKRHRPSQETIEMAAKFKQSYARYQRLHHDIMAHDNPDPVRVTDLLDMHERLSRMKTEIYSAVEA